jgi:hypothetical protein
MSAPQPPPAAPLPAAVDLDEDIRNRTPSGWPMQARVAPLCAAAAAAAQNVSP